MGTFDVPYASLVLLTLLVNLVSVPMNLLYERVARTALGCLLKAIRVNSLMLLIGTVITLFAVFLPVPDNS